MKKFTILMGLLVVSVGLYACGDTEVEASLPSGFQVITKDDINRSILYKLQQMDTGCYYAFSHSRTSSTGEGSVTQMFIEKDGVSVPYCAMK